MKNPTITAINGKRSFDCIPAAVQGYFFNHQREILLLKHPQRSGWEVVNGALKGCESVMEGCMRGISPGRVETISLEGYGIHLDIFIS